MNRFKFSSALTALVIAVTSSAAAQEEQGGTGSRRKGLMLGADLRVSFLSDFAPIIQPTFNLGYEAFYLGAPRQRSALLTRDGYGFAQLRDPHPEEPPQRLFCLKNVR